MYAGSRPSFSLEDDELTAAFFHNSHLQDERQATDAWVRINLKRGRHSLFSSMSTEIIG